MKKFVVLLVVLCLAFAVALGFLARTPMPLTGDTAETQEPAAETAAPVDVETLNELHVFSGSAQPSPALQHMPAAVLVPPPAKKKKDLARELGVSRTTLWRMSKRQEAASQKKDKD